MKDKKLFRVVFTLSSGKTIVYTMTEENATKAFESWKSVAENPNSDDHAITDILKQSGETLIERLGIDRRRIDAIQIEPVAERPDYQKSSK